MWLPSDLSVLATGHKFVIDLCYGVIRGNFELDMNRITEYEKNNYYD